MEHSVFKVFFSKIKESEWLNKMGEEGYLLREINDSRYIFTKDQQADTKYSYSIEYLDCSPQSEVAISYYSEREGCAIKPLISSGNWVYFVSSECKIKIMKEMYKKGAAFYLIRSLYLLFFAICASVLTGYQFFAKGFLETIGLHGDGKITNMLVKDSSTGFFDAIFNGLKAIVNHFFKMLNGYFNLWTNIFGKNDAVAVLSIVIPIVLILLVIAAFNVDEYLKYTKLIADASKEDSVIISEEGTENAEQTV